MVLEDLPASRSHVQRFLLANLFEDEHPSPFGLLEAHGLLTAVRQNFIRLEFFKLKLAMQVALAALALSLSSFCKARSSSFLAFGRSHVSDFLKKSSLKMLRVFKHKRKNTSYRKRTDV